MAVEQPDPHRQPGQIRFGMRRLMLFVTAVCVTLGTGLWFGPGLAVFVVSIALQLPLMLLVRRKLANDNCDGDQDSDS